MLACHLPLDSGVVRGHSVGMKPTTQKADRRRKKRCEGEHSFRVARFGKWLQCVNCPHKVEAPKLPIEGGWGQHQEAEDLG